MPRPSFQFYPGDWRRNANLRRCTEAARGAWIDILCVLHDSDEYGVVRWPLTDLAHAAGVKLQTAQELARKGVLKGADAGGEPFIFTPYHAGKHGEPVTLIDPRGGPAWFSSRFVRDEWIRQRRGTNTRFTAENQPPKPTIGTGIGGGIGERQGDGPSTASSSSEVSSEGSKKKNATPKSVAVVFDDTFLPDWLNREAWAGYLEMRQRCRAAMTPRAKRLAIAALDKLRLSGVDPAQVLDQSTQNSWKGLFPLKTEQTNGHGRPRQSHHERAYDVARELAGNILGGGGSERGEAGGAGAAAIALSPAGTKP